MLHEYRKTATIKAEQFDGSDEIAKKYDVHWRIGDYGFIALLPTREGNMLIRKGDYIATGVDGEHWVIAPDIFKRTYERVD